MLKIILEIFEKGQSIEPGRETETGCAVLWNDESGMTNGGPE